MPILDPVTRPKSKCLCLRKPSHCGPGGNQSESEGPSQACPQHSIESLAHMTPFHLGFPGGSEVKASASNAGDLGSIPGSGRFPGEGNGGVL